MIKTQKNILVYPRSYFVEDLLRLKQSGRISLNLAFNQTGDANQWLVNKTDDSQAKTEKLVLRFALLKNDIHPSSNLLQADFSSVGHLYLKIDDRTEPHSVSGFLRHENRIVEFDELFLVGAEMLKIPTVNTKQLIPLKDDYEAFLESPYACERWQMSRKALGEQAWKRLCLLKMMIVGAGRSGETAFLELARFGVGKITVCDGDNLERRNLGEMKLVTDSELGHSKAQSLVQKMRELRRSPERNDCYQFRAVDSFNFDSYEAQKAAEESDVIVCCVDSDGARSYASYIAARHHKVLLDIGSGVSSVTKASTGYDVRLILPGDGCLKCCGGIDEKRGEIEMFNRYERQRQRQEGHLLREGSLSYLNSLAVNEGIALLQDLCRGEIKNSTWIQYEKTAGRTLLNSITKTQSPNCDCEKAGLGNLFFSKATM